MDKILNKNIFPAIAHIKSYPMAKFNGKYLLVI